VTVDPDIMRQLRQVVRRLDGAQAERDRLIREAHAQGASLRQIAAAAGLTHQGVSWIVNRDVEPG